MEGHVYCIVIDKLQEWVHKLVCDGLDIETAQGTQMTSLPQRSE